MQAPRPVMWTIYFLLLKLTINQHSSNIGAAGRYISTPISKQMCVRVVFVALIFQSPVYVRGSPSLKYFETTYVMQVSNLNDTIHNF